MKHLHRLVLAATLLGSVTVVQARQSRGLEADAVVASVKPVHSLVAAVMEGVGTPHLIVRGGASPHTYSLRPSDAAKLEQAKAVFWIGDELEIFLAKPIESLSKDAKLVTLSEAHGLNLVKLREGGAFEPHDHGGEGHHDEKHQEHENPEMQGEGHAHDHEHDHQHAADHDRSHHHGAFDMHIWLDPVNAKVIVHEIEEALINLDPANAALYKANAGRLAGELDNLRAEVNELLSPVRDRPFVVFHDAYHYFEERFGLSAAGSITVTPDVIPGAQRIAEIQQRMRELGGVCVFSEPQFEPKLVRVVTEGTGAGSAELDPLGVGLKDGPELYFQLIRNMAAAFKDCLSENS